MGSMHPKDLSIIDFSYDLPADKIAKFPLPKRDESRLLVYQSGKITESLYKDLEEQLPRNTSLIFNNTRVIEARLIFNKASGSSIEIFCLEPDDSYSDITSAMLQKGKVNWKCLVGGAKKWKEELITKKFIIDNKEITLTAKKNEKKNDYFIIELSWNNPALSFAEILHYAGILPLPPYLNRVTEEPDKETYQTVYAKQKGSVAAPTAGLHFTKALFNKLEKKKIYPQFITLHVGAGTFKPVKSDTMETHDMHSEFIDVTIDLIEYLLANINENIVAVGTTSLRTIESLYWMGSKISQHYLVHQEDLRIEAISVQQWDPYPILSSGITAKTSLACLLQWMKRNKLDRIISKTQIIIAPGYEFKIVQGLITNFHQPQSTLLLLVAALIGDDWKKVYQHALNNNFRFLSYGDGCLLWKKNLH